MYFELCVGQVGWIQALSFSLSLILSHTLQFQGRNNRKWQRDVKCFITTLRAVCWMSGLNVETAYEAILFFFFFFTCSYYVYTHTQREKECRGWGGQQQPSNHHRSWDLLIMGIRGEAHSTILIDKLINKGAGMIQGTPQPTDGRSMSNALLNSTVVMSTACGCHLWMRREACHEPAMNVNPSKKTTARLWELYLM